MNRNELKFCLNFHQKEMMTGKLSQICHRDSFSDADGGYLISSLYYDDYNRSALLDKMSGISDRKKFRIRVYNHQTNIIKLERKTKRNIYTEKSHIKITRQEYESLVNGDVSFLKHKEDIVARDFYLYYQTRNLRPRVIVEYRREAFTYKYGDVRITFDYSLKTGAYNQDLLSPGYLISAFPQDQLILEVKYTGYLPDVIRYMIQINTLQWQALSKYVLCYVAGM